MTNVQKHLSRYPRARAQTIAYLTARDEKTKQLQAEIASSKEPKTLEQQIAYYYGKVRQMIVGRV